MASWEDVVPSVFGIEVDLKLVEVGSPVPQSPLPACLDGIQVAYSMLCVPVLLFYLTLPVRPFTQDFAVVKPQATGDLLTLVDVDTLPVPLRQRCRELFRIKPRWKLAEISPFVASVIPPFQKVEEAIKPFVRLSEDEADTRTVWVNSRF